MNVGASVERVGIIGPGLSDWGSARPVLAAKVPYTATPVGRLTPGLLPQNERRRATQTIRLALKAAEDALTGTDYVGTDLCSVFASASGDLEIIDRICEALTQPGRPVSPTQFHNSVHNAPAGYWAIGARSMGGSTSLAAYDATFAVGLLDALVQVAVEQTPTLLVAYDAPSPAALQAARPVTMPFALALLLTPRAGTDALGWISLGRSAAVESTPMHDGGLESLRRANPAARALPLLASIAAASAGRVVLPYLADRSLAVEFET